MFLIKKILAKPSSPMFPNLMIFQQNVLIFSPAL